MKPQLNVIRTAEGVDALAIYLLDKEFIAYDSETTGLLRTDQVVGVSFCASEDRADYIVLAEWDNNQGKLIDLGIKGHVEDLLNSIKHKSLIMHNAIFDASMAEAFFKISLIDSVHTDTLILAHLLDENRPKGLKPLARQYFGISSNKEAEEMKASVETNGGMITKDAFEMYKADSALLGKYGAQDAMLTYKLFYALVPELYESGLDKFFYEDESMPLLRGPTYELNTTGLKMDREAVITLKQTLEAECLEAHTYIYQEIDKYIKDKYPGTKKTNTFNIASGQQLAWLMFDKLELEFGTLTDGGKEICHAMGLRIPYGPPDKRNFIRQCQSSVGHVYQEEVKTAGKTIRAKKIKEPWCYLKCDNKVLSKYALRYKWVERLLEYKQKQKILNTYVIGFQERTHYGIINPGFNQTGTVTGRYASTNPNFQNLPRKDKRVKECVIARPGKVFVGADQSQLEPRTFAYFSKDERLTATFMGTDDFYSVIGMEVFGKTDCTPHKEGSPDAFGVKYPELRHTSKEVALASTYGTTAFQLAPKIKKTQEETQAVINRYFERFPDVKKLQLESHAMAKEQGFVTNLFGRKRNLPDAMLIDKELTHGELEYAQRNLLNQAINFRIQSTGASIVNRGAIMFHKRKTELGIDCKLVVQVHDSLVVECNEADAETVALILRDSMEYAVQLEGIAFESIPKIGRNLSEV